jgi:hypothetical protein
MRKRRWFGSTDFAAKPASSQSSIAESSVPNLGDGAGVIVADEGSGSTGKSPSITSSRSAAGAKPRRASSLDGHSSGRSSLRGGRTSMTDTDRKSLTKSIREKEIEEAENTVDQWGNRPGGPAEQAGRSWGLGDDAHMGLS